jgi:hypothetical protein
MFDENSPEKRLALAPYEESIARFDAKMAAIGEEFARELSEADKAAAQRDKEQSEQLAALIERETQQQPNQWTAPREKETTISFGDFDDEQKSWSMPTPPMGLPPIPPIVEPPPEPPRPAAPEPMMKFGDLEDDETSPPPPVPRPGRRRLQEEDEDLSGQTWLS